MDDDDGGESLCRVCRCEGTPEDPLFYPCRCSGSIKYIHEDCLTRWLQHSQKTNCELCKHPFEFSPVYHKNMPSKLPLWMLLVGAVKRALLVSKLFLRYLLVAFTWFVFVPYATKMLFAIYFRWSTGPPDNLLSILVDCLDGTLIFGSLLLLFIGVFILRDTIFTDEALQAVLDRQDPVLALPAVPVLAPTPADDAEDSDAARRRAYVEADEHRRTRLNSAAERASSSATSSIDSDDEDVNVTDVFDDDLPHTPEFSDDAFGFMLDDDLDLGPDNPHHLHGDGGDGDAHDNAAADAAPAGDQDQAAAAAGAQNGEERPFNGWFDGNEEVSLEEVIGLKGPLLRFAENVFWVLLFNSTLLGGFVFIPSFLGNLTIETVRVLFAYATYLTSTFYPIVEEAVEMATEAIAKASEAVVESANVTLSANATDPASFRSIVGLAVVHPHSIVTPVLTVILGYAVIAMLLLLYMRVLSFLLRASPQSAFKRSQIRVIRFFIILAKVTVRLFIEVAVFPLVFGLAVDYCTLPLFGASVGDRVAGLLMAPFSSFFAHWLLGMYIIWNVSLLHSTLLAILRPGVLWFLRTHDTGFVQDMIEQPVLKQTRTLVLTLGMYVGMIFAVVGGAVTVSAKLLPWLVPFNWIIDDPIGELPFDVATYYSVIGAMVLTVPFGDIFRGLTAAWVSACARMLSLSSYLLGRDHADEVADDTNDWLADADADDDARPVHRPPLFGLRLIVFGALSCVAAVTLLLCAVLVPVSVGRVIARLFTARPVHEMYTLGFGVGAAWIVGATVAGLRRLLAMNRAIGVLHSIATALRLVFVVTYFVVVVGAVIPLLVGIIWQLTIQLPALNTMEQVPAIYFLQAWWTGLMFTNMGLRVIYYWGNAQTRRFIQGLITERGLRTVNLTQTTLYVMFPIIAALLGIIVTPMIVVFEVFPRAGMALEDSIVLFRMSYFLMMFCGLVALGLMRVRKWLLSLQDTIRDDRFLVGRRLHNFDNEATQAGRPVE